VNSLHKLLETNNPANLRKLNDEDSILDLVPVLLDFPSATDLQEQLEKYGYGGYLTNAERTELRHWYVKSLQFLQSKYLENETPEAGTLDFRLDFRKDMKKLQDEISKRIRIAKVEDRELIKMLFVFSGEVEKFSGIYR